MRHPIPDEALDDRLAFVGTSGSGKTYAASGSVERLLQRRARSVVVDPLGVWYGLRLNADGKTASRFNVVIFGGPHGDLPLTENAGSLIGETVATMAESCIVDLSELPTKAAERRFMLAFLDAIYRKTDPRQVDPYHIVFDEADLWAPQKSSEPMLQSRMEEIVRRGRIRGFIPWLITQRPAVISKDVLSQADGLIAMQLTSSQDRDAVGGWIEGQADRAQGKAILGSLPTMQKGQGVVWIPARAILNTVQFPTKITFDSSRTPKRGERKQAHTLAPLDIAALKTKLATVEQETKANDPKALKAEILRLKSALADQSMASAHVPAEELEIAARNSFAAGREAGIIEGKKIAVQAIARFGSDLAGSVDRAQQACADASRLLVTFAGFADELAKDMPPAPPAVRPMIKPLYGRTAISVKDPNWRNQIRQPVIDATAVDVSGGQLPKAERSILSALAHWGTAARRKIAVFTGYSLNGGGFKNALSSLRTKGAIDGSDPVTITSLGRTLIPVPEPMPNGPELLDRWLKHPELGRAERLILQTLCEALPGDLSREEVADRAGYDADGGGFKNAISKLRTLELIAGSKQMRATEMFEEAFA